jgi:uncharacterized repeat protein (TIGR03803 family)
MSIGDAFRLLYRLPLASLLLTGAPALAQTWPPGPLSEATLYSFPGGAGGAGPLYVTLVADSKGALYGTTDGGGANGFGAVFKLTPPAPGTTQWSETTLYSFSGYDGANPDSGLVRASNGALYGVTTAGGANAVGVAYQLTPPVPPYTQWSFSKIYDFAQPTAAQPYAAPVFDGAGALIGSAAYGGAHGMGAIYKLTPPNGSGNPWTETTLFSFTGHADGSNPYSQLFIDTSGAIYGTASTGGASNGGLVFQLTPPGANCTPVSPNLWCETVLHDFNLTDGASPLAGVTLDASSGVFYGTAQYRGAHSMGVVYSLTPPVPPSTQWLHTVLYNFAGGLDGAVPRSPLTLIGGSLYGSTLQGGGTGCGGSGCGTLFQLSPPAAPTMRWAENIVYRFTGGVDSASPAGGLIFNALPFGFGSAAYGVAAGGGASSNGTVFSLQCARAAREVFGGGQHAACMQ